jgi:hypothetical protein
MRGARVLPLLPMPLLLLVAACKDEPSFDDRYDKAEKLIRGKAAEIDRQLESGTASADPSS